MPKKEVKRKNSHAFSGADLISTAAKGLAAIKSGRLDDLRRTPPIPAQTHEAGAKAIRRPGTSENDQPG